MKLASPWGYGAGLTLALCLLAAVLLLLDDTSGDAGPHRALPYQPSEAHEADADDVGLGDSGVLSPAASPVFVDNADPQGVTIMGSWQTSSGAQGSYNEGYLHDNNSGKGAKSVQFTPLLPETRVYSVYLRWPEGGAGLARNTPVVITHAGGTTSINVDQQLGGGAWNRLGSFHFRAGRAGSVLIANTGTGGTVVADAVSFVPALDLKALTQTFSEEFDAAPEVCGYADWPVAPRKWFASTPYTQDGYGDARFGEVGNPPFSVASGVLSIRASKTKKGWVSGMLSSARPDGSGFLQRFGYFEARMKFPAGMGTWPSFWLLGAGSLGPPGTRYGEIDVIEFYGNQPNKAYTASHVWNQIGSEAPGGVLQSATVHGLSEDFHTYGVLVRDDFTTWYVDGVPQMQTPTLPENKEPLYMMVCFALGGGWPTIGVDDPSFTQVDYVRAYGVPP